MALSFSWWKHHTDMRGVMHTWSKETAMQQQRSQKKAEENQSTLRRSAARLLRRWSALQRSSNLALAFSWWKRHSDVQALAETHIEDNQTRTKQLARAALRRLLH